MRSDETWVGRATLDVRDATLDVRRVTRACEMRH